MFRHNSIKKTGPFDQEYFYAPDWDMWLKNLYVGDYYFIKEHLSMFRVSKTSATTHIMFNKGKEMLKNDKLLLDKHKSISAIKINKVDEAFHYINLVKGFVLRTIFLKFLV
ncbi:hypothetical protein D3C75_947260 [compost metagenome]